jgi:uncharacterized protein
MKTPKLVELEKLLSEIEGDEVFNIEQLHGMLTAVIIGPEMVMPSVWLPFVFNSKGEMPEFKSQNQAQNLMGLIMEFYNDTIHELDRKDAFIPYIGGETKNGKTVIDPEPWCEAFLEGMRFCGDYYEEYAKDEDSDLNHLLVPFIYFGDPDEKEYIIEHTRKHARKKKDMDEELLGIIPGAVKELRDFWRENKPSTLPPKPNIIPFAPRLKDPKTGRNDACPCGSGKKYKKCCGKIGLN